MTKTKTTDLPLIAELLDPTTTVGEATADARRAGWEPPPAPPKLVDPPPRLVIRPCPGRPGGVRVTTRSAGR